MSLEQDISEWLQKSLGGETYPDARLPENLDISNEYSQRAEELLDMAKDIAETHEARNFEGGQPLTALDYEALSAAHKTIAEGHKDLADQLDDEVPSALDAIAAHSAASETHNEAAEIAEMMATQSLFPGERNAMWRNSMSNLDRFSHEAKWDTEAKNWRKSHEAFLASQKAYNNTNFEVGVVEKGDLPGHEFHGNQYTHGHAVAHLRKLASDARAANEKSRLKTDVLGISGPRSGKDGNYNRSVPTYSTPRYLQSQTDNAKQHNSMVASHADKLADAIEADPSKPLAQHIEDFSNNLSDLQSQGMFHSQVDNYDTAANFYRSATTGSAVLDSLRNDMAGVKKSVSTSLTAEDHKEAADLHERLSEATTGEVSKAHSEASEAHIYASEETTDENSNYALAKSVEAYALNRVAVVEKGDVPGHPFHGNQYTEGIVVRGGQPSKVSGIPTNVGHRDFDPQTTADQIGRMTVMAISGGRVHTLHGPNGGKVVGLEMPVSNGYKVRVYYADNDTYTVQRVFSRGGNDKIMGEVTDVHAPELSDTAYDAGMFRSNDFGGHKV